MGSSFESPTIYSGYFKLTHKFIGVIHYAKWFSAVLGPPFCVNESEGVDAAQRHSLTEGGRSKDEKEHDVQGDIIRRGGDDQPGALGRCTGGKPGVDL